MSVRSEDRCVEATESVDARVVSAQADPKHIEDTDQPQELGDSLATNGLAQPGSCDFFGLIDRATGAVMTITLWETPQDLEASEPSGYLRRQLASAQPIRTGPVTRETFEVVAHSELPED
ncbi:hypothetical protein BH23CHL2_BH23CHL2_24050 [soil metagenome]